MGVLPFCLRLMHWRGSAMPSPGGKVLSEAKRMRNGDIL